MRVVTVMLFLVGGAFVAAQQAPQLPAPFATPSATNAPRVVEPPAGAMLHVPQGFSVSTWASGFDMPRFMLLAPGGEILLSDMRIVFVGDVFVATNQLQAAGGNKSLLTNSINWLTANEDLIQIPPKVPTDRMLILSSTQLNLLLVGSAIFIPVVVLAAGIAVWWSRR